MVRVYIRRVQTYILASLVPRLSPSTRAIYVRINTREGKELGINAREGIINAYVNCARGGGEPGNEAIY